jgi:hypothetical protein
MSPIRSNGNSEAIASYTPIEVRTPTLVIGGTKSDARLRAAVDATTKAIPNAQLRTLKGQTHNVKPEALTPVVTDFFTA